MIFIPFPNTRYYAQGNVSQDQYIQFIRHDTLGFEYLDQSKNFAPQVLYIFDIHFWGVLLTIVFVQVRKDYEKIKRETNFSLIETSREDVLAQKRKDPDTNEAFQYYAATFDYTEKLRNVLIGLRKRLVPNKLLFFTIYSECAKKSSLIIPHSIEYHFVRDYQKLVTV